MLNKRNRQETGADEPKLFGRAVGKALTGMNPSKAAKRQMAQTPPVSAAVAPPTTTMAAPPMEAPMVAQPKLEAGQTPPIMEGGAVGVEPTKPVNPNPVGGRMYKPGFGRMMRPPSNTGGPTQG